MGAAKQRAGPGPARGRARPSPPHGQDWPALKDQVIGWMAEGLQGQHEYDRVLRQTIGSGAGRVDVEVEHLLDDYWWVTATRVAVTDANDAAMAVLRIRDSKHRLRYGAGYSVRIS